MARLRSGSSLGRVVALLLMVAMAAVRIWDPPPVEELRVRSFDFMQAVMPAESKLRPVVIVDIDEESLGAIGQWPWPRTIIADLVTKVNALGAVVVGFDVVFAEPDRYSPGALAGTLRDLDAPTRERLAGLPSNDEVLAQAFRAARVVVGQSGVRRLEGTDARPPRPTSVATIGGDPSPFMVAVPGVLPNVAVLDAAAAGRGMFTIRPERDGIVRRVPLAIRAGGVIVPSLSLEMLRVAAGSGPILIRTESAGIRSIGVRGLEVPTDRNGQTWIRFTPHDRARYVSAQDVLSGKTPKERIEQRLVLIGTSAIGLLDRQTTPIDPSMPGVEIHAQILENALSGSWISHPDFAIGAELVTAVLTSLAIIILAPILGAMTVLGLGAVVAVAFVGVSSYLFWQQGTLIDFTYPLGSTLVVYLVLVFTNYLREQAQRQQIRSAFGQYLSPDLVEQLVQSPGKLTLGGELREMTIMFSDVRGFTAIAESYKDDPQGLTTLMNRLLTPLTNAIIAHHGTIDKYIGDAVMAFWNAPLPDTDHPAHGCAAALEMCRRLEALNLSRAEEAAAAGQPFLPIRIGIGVNTGPCVVGNMGSDLRFNYSVLGDTVNLTSRIEGQTKTYGVPILAGATTVAAAKDFAALELDLLRVKGKTAPEFVYAILGAADVAAREDFHRLRELNAQMLGAFRAARWAEASEALAKCRALPQTFGLSHYFDLYAARIRELEAEPPPPGWDGVWVALEK